MCAWVCVRVCTDVVEPSAVHMTKHIHARRHTHTNTPSRSSFFCFFFLSTENSHWRSSPQVCFTRSRRGAQRQKTKRKTRQKPGNKRNRTMEKRKQPIRPSTRFECFKDKNKTHGKGGNPASAGAWQKLQAAQKRWRRIVKNKRKKETTRVEPWLTRKAKRDTYCQIRSAPKCIGRIHYRKRTKGAQHRRS